LRRGCHAPSTARQLLGAYRAGTGLLGMRAHAAAVWGGHGAAAAAAAGGSAVAGMHGRGSGGAHGPLQWAGGRGHKATRVCARACALCSFADVHHVAHPPPPMRVARLRLWSVRSIWP